MTRGFARSYVERGLRHRRAEQNQQMPWLEYRKNERPSVQSSMGQSVVKNENTCPGETDSEQYFDMLDKRCWILRPAKGFIALLARQVVTPRSMAPPVPVSIVD
jgi:hypothetical protein